MEQATKATESVAAAKKHAEQLRREAIEAVKKARKLPRHSAERDLALKNAIEAKRHAIEAIQNLHEQENVADKADAAIPMTAHQTLKILDRMTHSLAHVHHNLREKEFHDDDEERTEGW